MSEAIPWRAAAQAARLPHIDPSSPTFVEQMVARRKHNARQITELREFLELIPEEIARLESHQRMIDRVLTMCDLGEI